MRTLLVFVALFAIANAGFLNFREAAKPLVDQTVSDFVKHMQVHGKPLNAALKTKRSLALAQFEREVQTELGQVLQEQLNNVMAQIQDAIDHGQLVAQSLIDKAKELMQQLSQAGGNIFQIAQQFLQMLVESGQNFFGNLLDGLGIGKRNIIGNLLDTILQALNLDELLSNILSGLLGGIGKQRDILSGLLSTLLGSVLGNLDLSSIPILGDLLGLLGKREVQDPRIWSTIMDTLTNIWQSISDSFSDFKDWVQQIAGESLNTLQGHFANIKELAQLFLGHATELTNATIDQAVEFFRPYHEDLGVLWQQILDAAQQAHQTVIG